MLHKHPEKNILVLLFMLFIFNLYKISDIILPGIPLDSDGIISRYIPYTAIALLIFIKLNKHIIKIIWIITGLILLSNIIALFIWNDGFEIIAYIFFILIPTSWAALIILPPLVSYHIRSLYDFLVSKIGVYNLRAVTIVLVTLISIFFYMY